MHTVCLANKVPEVASQFRQVFAGFILKTSTNTTNAGCEYNIVG